MGKLIVVSAPSGAGKTTLCQYLLRDFPELKLSISSTTREPRGQETHGNEYLFLTQTEFKLRIDRQEFAEWALVHGNYYGTSKTAIEQAFSEGKSLLLDIDVQGAKSIRAAYPKESALIFIQPPDMPTLESRLRARGTESEDKIQKRLSNAQTELAQAKQFDHVLTNDELSQAYAKLRSIVSHLLGLASSG